MPQLKLNYPEILQLLGPHAMKERTESRALLAWFIENYYRLDETEVQDCICDARYDRGIDGIYVNEQLAQIDVFQSVIVKTPTKTLGDKSLREFAGTLLQFKTKESVAHMQDNAKNPELAALLKDQQIAKRIEEKFEVRGVFVTNAERDQNAKDFLAVHQEIILYDRPELERSYIAIEKTEAIATPMTFDVSSVPHLDYPIGGDLRMVIAPLAAQELVNMEGIANGELFTWNVRQWLGKKTKVNLDIETSIGNQTEHRYFPAFHNGLTVLCKSLAPEKDKITVSGYAVVNGCQSLTSLYENRAKITSDLRIWTKFIQVPPNSPLAAKITDHTNNQNGTTYRDLKSNNPIQTRLQTEIHKRYKNQAYYRIKRGEHPEWDESKVIENELVARVLLAFDLKNPSSCHQTYKLFDEFHADIFGGPEVNADRIIMANDIHTAVREKVSSMANELFGRYTLTRYLVIFLLREALETDSLGKRLVANPGEFLSQPAGRARLYAALKTVIGSLARLLDNEATRRNQPPNNYFDYKSELKSPRFIQEVRSIIISHYQIIVDSGMAPVSFSGAWKAEAAAAGGATK